MFGKDKKLKEKQTPGFFCDRGDSYLLQNNPNKAISCYEQALEIDNLYTRAYISLGNICVQYGQPDDAIGYYAAAIHCAPDNQEYKIKIATLLERRVPSSYNHEFVNLIIDIMKSGATGHSYSFGIWHRLLKINPAFSAIIDRVEANDYNGFARELDDPARFKLFLDPFFLWGIRRLLVNRVWFENLIIYLRKYILIQRPDIMDITGLATSLASYVLSTEYIMPLTEEEKNAIDQMICSPLTKLYELAIVGCYRRLSEIPEFEKKVQELCKTYDDPYMKEFYDLHIGKQKIQNELKKTILPLTDIDSIVSKQVREQYESFPYPQWVSYTKELRDNELEGPLKGKQIKILVAGCGTGREAIEHAICFPDAEVTAIDLSLSSLAYAKMKAIEIGVENIRFLQADILKLDNWTERFDYISSSGVIHHMENPEQGLKILEKLMKPDGLMRLGLYSAKARRKITEVARLIIAQGYKNNAEGIIEFRQKAKTILPPDLYENISKLKDFYKLSECRDLLFNIQEHCLDLPDIKLMLENANLKFEKFYIEQEVLDMFKKKNKGKDSVRELDKWSEFEKDYPDTFISMYAFWCRKVQ